MRGNVEVKRIADGIYEEVVKNIKEFADVRKADIATIAEKNVEEGLEVVMRIITGVESMFKAANIDGVGLPAFLSKVTTTSADHVTSIHLRVSSKLRADVKFRMDEDIDIDDSFIYSVADVYEKVLYQLFYAEIANENVKELNARIADLVVKNDIPYTFEFAVRLDTDAPVISITDKNVIFNANIKSALEIPAMTLFVEGDAYYDLIREEAEKNLVEALKGVETPVQLIKANIKLIRDITNLATKKRASRIIRMSYHRQAKFLNAVNAGVGYFNETVNVGGEDTEVFALVEKSEDGTLATILSPFNVKTLMNVDYDVVGALA